MKTIGVLYPGDMGHSVARVLLEDGFSIVTTLLVGANTQGDYVLKREHTGT